MMGQSYGIPVATATGEYVMATSNTVDETGYFTVFNIATPGSLAYTFSGTDPFGDIGYFYNPLQGYYFGGFENRNDVFIWSTGIPASFTGGGDINGTTYAFQLPVVSGNPLNVTVLAEGRAFVSNERPILANEGLNMYWSTYKNEFMAWAGEVNVKRTAFDQRANNVVRPGGRGNPRWISARAPPTLSYGSNNTAPTVYGPQADGFIFKANFDYSTFESFAADEDQPFSSRVVVSPDNTVLFYASPLGNLVQVDADSMQTIYAIASTGQYVGEIAQSVDGAYIYTADTSGNIRAYLVADVVDGPTLEPLPGAVGTIPPTPDETPDGSEPVDGNFTSFPGGPEEPEPTPTPGGSPTAPSPGGPSPPTGPSPDGSPTDSGTYMVRMTLAAIAITVSALFV
jgi:hypothetical protein